MFILATWRCKVERSCKAKTCWAVQPWLIMMMMFSKMISTKDSWHQNLWRWSSILRLKLRDFEWFWNVCHWIQGYKWIQSIGLPRIISNKQMSTKQHVKTCQNTYVFPSPQPFPAPEKHRTSRHSPPHASTEGVNRRRASYTCLGKQKDPNLETCGWTNKVLNWMEPSHFLKHLWNLKPNNLNTQRWVVPPISGSKTSFVGTCGSFFRTSF